MDYIISLHDKKNSFSPERTIRLNSVTRDYAKGYKDALIKENPNHRVYLEVLE